MDLGAPFQTNRFVVGIKAFLLPVVCNVLYGTFPQVCDHGEIVVFLLLRDFVNPVLSYWLVLLRGKTSGDKSLLDSIGLVPSNVEYLCCPDYAGLPKRRNGEALGGLRKAGPGFSLRKASLDDSALRNLSVAGRNGGLSCVALCRDGTKCALECGHRRGNGYHPSGKRRWSSPWSTNTSTRPVAHIEGHIGYVPRIIDAENLLVEGDALHPRHGSRLFVKKSTVHITRTSQFQLALPHTSNSLNQIGSAILLAKSSSL